MVRNQIGENIARYRKEKGLSQEKVSEYMGVSRQAVTKWESNISKPSSDNLIKLAELFDIGVDVLLNNNDNSVETKEEKVSLSKTPWFLIGISITCAITYLIVGNMYKIFSAGTFICMFVLCFPSQLFLHIFFSNSIKNNDLTGIAGFDNKIKYNISEVKKLLVQIDLHISMLSTVYVALLCILNCVDMGIDWLNGLLIILYIISFVGTVVISNYKMADMIFRNEEDKNRAKYGMPITLIYTLLIAIGIGVMFLLFEIKEIENNTAPAIKLAGVFLAGISVASIGYLVSCNEIKKWNPDETTYKPNKISIFCAVLCLVLYGLMSVL